MLSVHDNLVYALNVDYETCRVVLHTVYPHSDPAEFTDVEFDGVVTHHIETQAFKGYGVAGNILFDVEEAEAVLTLNRYADLLRSTKNYAWPVVEYADVNDLASRLTIGEVKCFEIHSSCGLCGFVFAASMRIRRRSSRVQVIPSESSPLNS